MKLRNLLLAALVLPAVGIASIIAMPAEIRTQPASAAQNEKYDGDCTGNETDGRCSDKCPAGSYLIDYRDGQAICKLEPTGCPYGDSIPLGPECDKHAPAVPVTPATPVVVPTNQCGGTK